MNILEFGPRLEAGGSAPILFFHGFPGIRSKQNREIAEAVAGELHRPAQLMLYAGLGHAPGTFSFRACHRDTLAHLAGLLARGVRELDLVGHSWGGYLALSLCHELARSGAARVRRLVLISPLLDFGTAEHWGSSFAATLRDNPQLAFPPQDELIRDFAAMRDRLPVPELIAAVAPETETLLLQAAEDQVTPAVVAKSMLRHFRRAPRFELVDTDHSFVLNRERITPRIVAFLRDGSCVVGTVPPFETRRLLLKPVTLDIAADYTRHFVDYDVISHLSAAVPWPYPANGVVEYLESVVLPAQGKDRWAWGIYLKSNPGEAIGCIDIWRNGSPENRGFWLAKEHWGNGIMTEAVEPVMDFAFGPLGFDKLVFTNAVGNARSRRVKEKTGARLVAIEPARFVDPKYTEHEVWELTKQEWWARHRDK